MNRLSGEKISYQDALYHYVGALILIPGMIVGLYLMFMNYQSSIDLAEQKVSDTSEVIAHDLSLSITQLRLELEQLESDVVLAKASGKPFEESAAGERLAELVESNPHVSEAVLRAANGVNVAGYPGTSAGLRAPLMDRIAGTLARHPGFSSPAKLFVVDGIKRDWNGQEFDLPLKDRMFFAIPIGTRGEGEGSTPQHVLWVRVDMKRILADVNRPDWANDSRFSLSVRDALLVESQSADDSDDSKITASANLSVQAVRDTASQPIRFSLTESAATFTESAWEFFLNGAFILVAISAVLAVTMKRVSAMLNRPLQQLIDYAKHISNGEFEEAPKEIVFAELEDLRIAMKKMAGTVQQSITQLERFASTDCLTGLMNRRAFDDSGEREFMRAQRGDEDGKTLWLIILDIDFFKRVNDTAGHAVGDLVIQAVADVVGEAGRKSDVVGRLGGEEYGLLLPSATRAGVERIANSILTTVPTLTIEGWTEVGGAVTVSVGCASAAGKANFDELYRIADEALYESKRNGRNRVSFEIEGAANDPTGADLPESDAV